VYILLKSILPKKEYFDKLRTGELAIYRKPSNYRCRSDRLRVIYLEKNKAGKNTIYSYRPQNDEFDIDTTYSGKSVPSDAKDLENSITNFKRYYLKKLRYPYPVKFDFDLMVGKLRYGNESTKIAPSSHGKVKFCDRRRLMDRLLRYENHYSSGAEGHPPKDPSDSA